MELSRRSFLAGLGTIVGGLLISELPYQLLPSDKSNIVQPNTLNKTRVLCMYNPYDARYVIRYDMYDKVNKHQFNASAVIPFDCKPKEYIEKVHEPIEQALKNYLVSNRILVSNLSVLPVPSDYKHPDYFMDILKEIKWRT